MIANSTPSDCKDACFHMAVVLSGPSKLLNLIAVSAPSAMKSRYASAMHDGWYPNREPSSTLNATANEVPMQSR